MIPWVVFAVGVSGQVAWSSAAGNFLSCVAPVALLISIAGILLDESKGYAIAGAFMSGLFLLLLRRF
jgi:hypothetical protein